MASPGPNARTGQSRDHGGQALSRVTGIGGATSPSSAATRTTSPLVAQSAGALDTGFNMISPLAAGLFHRGLCESYCPIFQLATKTSASATGGAFSVAAGCGSGTGSATAKCLRSLTAAQVEALAGTESTQSIYISGTAFGIVDGQIIPDQPLTLFTKGQFSHMPLMNGNTEDEQTFSLAITEYYSGPPRVPPTAAHI